MKIQMLKFGVQRSPNTIKRVLDIVDVIKRKGTKMTSRTVRCCVFGVLIMSIVLLMASVYLGEMFYPAMIAFISGITFYGSMNMLICTRKKKETLSDGDNNPRRRGPLQQDL